MSYDYGAPIKNIKSERNKDFTEQKQKLIKIHYFTTSYKKSLHIFVSRGNKIINNHNRYDTGYNITNKYKKIRMQEIIIICDAAVLCLLTI